MQGGRGEPLLRVDSKCVLIDYRKKGTSLTCQAAGGDYMERIKFDTQLKPSKSPRSKLEMNGEENAEVYLQMGIIWCGTGDLNEECKDRI